MRFTFFLASNSLCLCVCVRCGDISFVSLHLSDRSWTKVRISLSIDILFIGKYFTYCWKNEKEMQILWCTHALTIHGKNRSSDLGDDVTMVPISMMTSSKETQDYTNDNIPCEWSSNWFGFLPKPSPCFVVVVFSYFAHCFSGRCSLFVVYVCVPVLFDVCVFLPCYTTVSRNWLA